MCSLQNFWQLYQLRTSPLFCLSPWVYSVTHALVVAGREAGEKQGRSRVPGPSECYVQKSKCPKEKSELRVCMRRGLGHKGFHVGVVEAWQGREGPGILERCWRAHPAALTSFSMPWGAVMENQERALYPIQGRRYDRCFVWGIPASAFWRGGAGGGACREG